ncbi:hypothetical protein AB4085_04785 [Vibrio cyclitrophicus]
MHTFIQERRKCLFSMGEKTLISFVLIGFKKSETKHFNEALKNGLLALLKLENALNEIVSLFENATSNISFIKTHSRKLLGHINDKMSLYQDLIYADGGLSIAI